MNQLNQEETPQRTATRAPVDKPVRLQFDDLPDVVEGHCVNVSIGGMYIHLATSQPQGSLVRFELLINEDHSIRGLGEVVWMRTSGSGTGREPGLGIKFRFLEQRDRQQIFKLVSQYIKERLSQRPSMTAAPIKKVTDQVPDDRMIFRPPDDSSTEPLDSPPGFESPGLESSSLLPSEDFARESPAPRRADSFLPDVEGLSGPLDLINEVEPWQEVTGSEEAWGPDSHATHSSTLDEPLDEEQDDDAEYLAPVQRRPPGVVGVVLLLLALIMVLAFFWGDLFGSQQQSAVGRPEGSIEGQEPAPEAFAVAAPEDSASSLSSPAPDAGISKPPRPPNAQSPPFSTAPSSTAPSSVPSPGTSQPTTKPAFSRLLDISWRSVPGGLEVVFTTDGTIPEKRWRHFRLSGDTPREVVRILGVKKPFGRTQIQVGAPGLRQIRVGYHKKSRGNELHVVMDMGSPSAKISRVWSAGSQLMVRVETP
jgi:hypothetical protein